MDTSGGDYRGINKEEVFFFEKKKQKTFVRLGLVILLGGAGLPQTCPLAGQRSDVRATLYFGRDRTGQAPVSGREWQIFAKNDLTRAFPDGFTETDGIGQWRDPATGRIVREASKIVDVVVDESGLPEKIALITGDYRREFQQESVGVVTEVVCAEF